MAYKKIFIYIGLIISLVFTGIISYSMLSVSPLYIIGIELAIIGIIWLILLLLLLVIWAIIALFHKESVFVKALLIWLLFPPKLFSYLKKHGKSFETSLYWTIISPLSVFIITLAFEGISWATGNPYPVHHYDIQQMIRNNTDVIIPEFKIVDYNYYDNFPDYSESYSIVFEDGFDKESISALDNSAKWDKKKKNEYSLVHFEYEYGVEDIPKKSIEIIINVKNNNGRYVITDF